jgi:hypothetical protein
LSLDLRYSFSTELPHNAIGNNVSITLVKLRGVGNVSP